MFFANESTIKRNFQHFQKFLMDHTEHKWRFDNFCPDSALSCQWSQARPIVRRYKLSILQANFIRVLRGLIKIRQPKLVDKWRLLAHCLNLNKSYVENSVDLMHWEALFDLNNEKVYRLLIALQNVDRVVTFTNQNFILFWREKLCKLSIADCWASKLEWCV